MSHWSLLRRVGGATALTLGLSAAVLSAGASDPRPLPAPTVAAKSAPQPVKSRDGSRLSSQSRTLLARAEAAGRKRVTVMALTPSGGTAKVAAGLRGLGATIGYRHDKVGYLRASLPTSAVTKAAALAGVQVMDLDETLAMPDPQIDAGKQVSSGSGSWTGPSSTTEAVNPYLPTHETGAVAFKASNPTWDGRGVTIGVLDSGVDLDTPALTMTSTGERKIVDWFTATDPLLESDGSWRPMLTHVKGPDAQYGGATWTLPARAGADYAMNTFRESSAASNEEYAGDVNRDGDKADVWGVLYDYESNDIWVDVNQNHDFTDDGGPMRPYGEKFQVGHFGTDDPKTPTAETVPFVVEFRKDVDLTPAGLEGRTADFVNIGIVSDAHGTHVAGIAAGHKLFGSIDGAAPGARIVSAKACIFAGGCTTVALSEGMIDLVANRKVDVVNMSIGGLPALNDANNVRARLYDRLIDTYGVQLFISAGNSGPGVNTIGDPSLATDVMSVGAVAGRDTWKANYGADVTAPMAVQNYSSRGPREDGGFKPDIVAPGSAISTVPRWWKSTTPPLPVSYTLPPGYAMFNGTSMASPEAAGAAALLLSAARAQDLAVQPRQLRESLNSTSRQLPDTQAVAQGTGLIDIVGAWQQLRTSPDVSSRYTISAPVCTVISDLLATKNRGPGIYNRCSPTSGGPVVGSQRTDQVTITRTAGPRGAARHDLRWVGNDGTFGAPTQVSLPLDKPVTVPVTSLAQAPGLHSATLQIDSPATPLVDARMTVAVVASHSLAGAPYTQRFSGSVQRTATTSYFVDVPKGTKALQVDLSGISAGSQVRWVAFNPYGVDVDAPTSKVTCYTNDKSDPKLCNATSRSYADPLPGVWELQVEAKRTTPTLRNPFTLRAAAQGVTVTPAEQTLAAQPGQPQPVQWSVRNDFGAVAAQGQGGPLGSGHRERPTISTGQKQQYEVVVPEGAASLEASIGNPSDLTADLDLYVYDSAGAVVARSADGDSEESVSIPKPKPGTYVVEVDGYSTAAGGTAYDYLDVFTSPTLGSVTVDPTVLDLAEREAGQISGVVTVRSAAAPGRSLVGDMEVVTEAGAVLGRGRVLLSVAGDEPTTAPTSRPTATMTGAPTTSPTVNPTASPTVSPTATVSPTPTSTAPTR